jgi:hypothetical protein
MVLDADPYKIHTNAANGCDGAIPRDIDVVTIAPRKPPGVPKGGNITAGTTRTTPAGGLGPA